MKELRSQAENFFQVMLEHAVPLKVRCVLFVEFEVIHIDVGTFHR